MDTPNRNHIEKPISTVEESPVFNYISNLSPIEPVKSVHITQSFQSLNFSSIPAVFTSPHISTQKESKYLRKYQFVDLSKPDFSPDGGDERKASSGVSLSALLPNRSADVHEQCNVGASIEEFNVVPPTERKKLAIKLCQTLKYDCGSSRKNDTSCNDAKMGNEASISATPASLVQCLKEGPEENCSTVETKVESKGTCQLEQAEEERVGCDWENLISDATTNDLLNLVGSTESDACRVQDNEFADSDSNANSFLSLLSRPPEDKIDSSQEARPEVDCREQDQKLVDSDPNSFASSLLRSPEDNIDDSQETQPLGFQKHAIQDPGSHPGEVGELNETDHTPEILLSSHQCEQGTRDPHEKMDGEARDYVSLGCKVLSQQQRGTRRRCLVFEVGGVHKKSLEDDPKRSHSNKLQCDGKSVADDKQSASHMTGTGSSPRKLPGIGLHLNALATTSKGSGVTKHETLYSGRRLISMPKPVGSFHSLTGVQQPLDKSLAMISIEGESSQVMKEAQGVQDVFQVPEFGGGEEFSPNSPKKKRRRLESAGESESCKRCNCKKSKCLKLYCECFAAGVYCVEPCLCQDCFNKPVHEDTVLATRKQIESRNPLAFAPKVIRSSESVVNTGVESNKTPASARHKKGCNCKKSSCLKKYCECFQGGVGCSSDCRCEGCKNKFGTNGSDRSGPKGIEEQEGEESEPAENDGQNELLMIEYQEEEMQYSGALPFTHSFRNCSFEPLAVASSPCLENTSQMVRDFDSLHPKPQFEKHHQNVPEDETPDILRGDCSPINGVKTSSPNRKRVSPPHNFGSSSGRRGVGDTVLQSIPPFPSLTPHHGRNNFLRKFQ
ncbi:hypothetical protein AAC387_Pa05g3007 [Persea americana]